MITFNMILHVFCIMNEGSEGIGEQEVDVRPVSYVQAACILQLSPVFTFLVTFDEFEQNLR